MGQVVGNFVFTTEGKEYSILQSKGSRAIYDYVISLVIYSIIEKGAWLHSLIIKGHRMIKFYIKKALEFKGDDVYVVWRNRSLDDIITSITGKPTGGSFSSISAS